MDGQPSLRVRTAGRDLVLGVERSLLLGRDPAADVRYDDHRVSRRHAGIRFDGARWRVEDLGSSNGTYVLGIRVPHHVVVSPVTVRLGNPVDGPAVELQLVEVGAAPHPAPPPPAVLPPPPVTPPEGPGDSRPGLLPAGAAAAPPAPESTASLPTARAGAAAPAASSVDLGPRVGIHQLHSGVVRIGRGAGSEIALDDPHVSRHHVELRWDQARNCWRATDMGSHNGTFLNGHRISSAEMRDGDVLSVGRRHLRMIRGALEEYESGDVRLDAVDLSVHTPDGRRALLQHVSLSVDKGSLVAVVGPSGAGKTTLLNALTGFKPADQGAVLYSGRNLYAEYEEMRRRIGYVPQDDIVHSQLTVRQELAYASELRFPGEVSRRERARRVDEVIQELGLGERGDLMIEKLSGGQRKRVNIGVELLTKPSPLFLDEPTSGLDPGMERGMMVLLRDLARSGRTVIVVTHAVQSLALCDRVLVLAAGGRVAFYGSPDTALRYFGRSDFVEIFQDLEAAADAPWDQRFWASREYADYVAQPLAALQPPSPRVERAPTNPQADRGWGRQTWILVRRYVRTMISDRGNFAFLMLQAPVLALIMLFAIQSGTFDATSSTGHKLAQVGVTILVLVMTMTGLLNAIREIVKEAPTYRRERFIGLSIPAYVISKLAVLAPVAIMQAIIIVLLGFATQPGDFSRPQLIVDAALIGIAAVSLGLMLSALTRSNDQAIGILIVVLVAQLVISMPILNLAHQAVLGQLSWLFSANWGVDAVASTVNLGQIQPMSPLPAEWAQGAWPWLGEILMLLLLAAASAGAAMWLLRRHDPTLLSRPARAPRPGAVVAQPVAAS